MTPAAEFALSLAQERHELAQAAEQDRTRGAFCSYSACCCDDGKHEYPDVVEWVNTRWAAYSDVRQAENHGASAHLIQRTATYTIKGIA